MAFYKGIYAHYVEVKGDPGDVWIAVSRRGFRLVNMHGSWPHLSYEEFPKFEQWLPRLCGVMHDSKGVAEVPWFLLAVLNRARSRPAALEFLKGRLR